MDVGTVDGARCDEVELVVSRGRTDGGDGLGTGHGLLVGH